MIKSIVTSLIITVLVSSCLAFGLSKFIGFWETFTITFVGQVIISYLWNNSKLMQTELEIEKTLNERYEIMSKNYATFTCPCGMHNFEEVIYLNEESVFTCPKCTNNIKVNITLTPTVVTSPLNLEKTLQAIKMLDETPDQ